MISALLVGASHVFPRPVTPLDLDQLSRGSSASARHTYHHWDIPHGPLYPPLPPRHAPPLPTLGPHDTDTIRRDAPVRPFARACTGWVQADLRGPLPPLEDLDRLRVGSSR